MLTTIIKMLTGLEVVNVIFFFVNNLFFIDIVSHKIMMYGYVFTFFFFCLSFFIFSYRFMILLQMLWIFITVFFFFVVIVVVWISFLHDSLQEIQSLRSVDLFYLHIMKLQSKPNTREQRMLKIQSLTLCD